VLEKVTRSVSEGVKHFQMHAFSLAIMGEEPCSIRSLSTYQKRFAGPKCERKHALFEAFLTPSLTLRVT
jgi:hypothetical protein